MATQSLILSLLRPQLRVNGDPTESRFHFLDWAFLARTSCPLRRGRHGGQKESQRGKCTPEQHVGPPRRSILRS